MALFDFLTAPNKADGDANGSLFTRMKDSVGNAIAKRHRAAIIDSTEALLISGRNDQSAVIIRADRKGNLITGNYNTELVDPFEGATVNVQKWAVASTTFSPSQSTVGGYNFNSTNLLTANSVSILQSQRLFYKYPRVPLQVKLRGRFNIATNSNADFGFGLPVTTTLLVPTGFAVRIVNGLWYAVITFNGSELATPSPILLVDGVTQLSTANVNSEFYVVDIILDDDNAVVVVQDTTSGLMIASAKVSVPLSSLAMWSATSLPFYCRVFNSSTAPSVAPIVTLGYVQILTTDWNIQADSSQLAGTLGLSSGRNPYTGASTTNHTNSTAPVSAALSNTAGGYGTTIMDGRFQFAAVAGSATDYCLFGFQVPIGSRFLCEGIHIELYNTGVAVATSATVFEWAMGFNSAAVSLATANIIRQEIGVQNLQIGAGVGAQATSIDYNFITPEVTESGRFQQVILNIPVGTATATEIFRGVVTVKGRFL